MTTPRNGKVSSTTYMSREEQEELASLVQQESLRFTAIDPGKFIGWARFHNNMPLTVGVLDFGDAFWDWLDAERPDLFVLENYIIRPKHIQGGYAHQWNHGEALQVIGAVKSHARRFGVPLVLQQSSIQSTESKRTGIPYKRGRSNDINSAVLHGSHWWFKTHGPTNATTNETQKGR